MVVGDKIGQVLSGTDEVLGVSGTLMTIAWVAVEWKVAVPLLTCFRSSSDFFPINEVARFQLTGNVIPAL